MSARTYISPDCAKQWEVLLLLLSSEEKNIDRTTENEIDTMNYFYNNEGVKKIMLQWLHEMNLSYARKTSESDTALKCNQVSFLWRQQGNDKYHANLIDDSYQCYSKSVIYANQNDTEYALALANRSAALLRLKRFKECIADIDLSIASGYKREMLHKLLLRKADCYIELNQTKNAQASIIHASEHAISLKLSAIQMAEFERHVRLLERKINTGEVTHSPDEYNVVLPECRNGVNPQFNAASMSIELKNNDTVGRHVIVKEALKRGDVLFSEEPYAWVTLPSEDPVCDMCCQPDINPLPCSSCSRSVYCSEACRSTAFTMFHKWECVGAQSDLFPTIGIAHLALRVLLISQYHGLPTPISLAKPTAYELFKSYSQVDKIDIYRAETPDFYRMFNLVTNFDKMNNSDYVQYAVTATMLILYLERYTSFFETFESGPLSDRERKMFAAAFMLRCMGQLVCNGHAALSLSTYDDGTGRTVTEREVRRATAIYPSAAMMNHSCDPNIVNTFYKNRLIIRCARELSAGAEVFNCYGPHRAREPTAQRRAHLRAQYMFQCMCSACADGDQQQFAMLFNAYACQSCKGPVLWQGKKAHCQHCNAEFFPERALAILDRAEELAIQAIQAKTPQEGCELMQASYRLKQQVWYRHHASLRAAADRLAKSYADAGEFSKSVELIKQNIQSLEYQYGSFSVEVAHELRKLSDVMLERILNAPRNSAYREWCLETHKIVRKAVQLTELNYGAWEPLVRRLAVQERVVGDLVQDTAAGLTQTDNIHHILHYNLKI
ncbi:unnamed protein product [Pieris macdunnoughi]|uniref:Protein-lysine N-methyltransferase SMYD4 n=1 Tax=Pieris macdunnoughi TaxID=345717 RepID=A0A821L1C4_9NEOP|nr:unnamed protein product [Pieris macdunnoughi]